MLRWILNESIILVEPQIMTRNIPFAKLIKIIYKWLTKINDIFQPSSLKDLDNITAYDPYLLGQ